MFSFTSLIFYIRRQRLFVEMEQMASRPFSHVLVELQVPPNFPRRVPVPNNRCTSGQSIESFFKYSFTCANDRHTNLAENRSQGVTVVGTQSGSMNQHIIETSLCNNVTPAPSSSSSHSAAVSSNAVRRRRRVNPSFLRNQ